VLCSRLPDLRTELALDFVVVNGENAAAGFGITDAICKEFYEAGVDVITTGNHVWAKREIMSYIDGDPRLLRPQNFPARVPGRGTGTYTTDGGRKVMVINVMGRIFMDPLDDPFAAVDAELAKVRLGGTVDFILVDMHAEATSEKMAMGHFCDGRTSLVVGTHSHVPTADTQLMPKGTAYQSDAGMCGDYESIIGMEKEEPLRRFIEKVPGGRFMPALGEATLCGVYVESDDESGLAVHVAPLRLGGRLAPAWPL
jgi:metallophosphoesterase (TIGR00282 family)